MFDLPERSSTPLTSPKTRYEAGQTNFFTTLDGYKGYIEFSDVQITQMSARIQNTRTGEPNVVTRFNLVFHDEEIGLVDEDGNCIPHPFYDEENYPHFANRRPGNEHRVIANQWTQPDNVDALVEMAHYLRDNYNFNLVTNPPKQPTRTTRDLFRANAQRPNNSDDLITALPGANVDAFEISVNPNYENGFKSFYDGLTEQQQRWDETRQNYLNAQSVHERDRAEKEIRSLADTFHFITGMYLGDDGNMWARQADTGMYVIGGNSFMLYEPKDTQASLSVDEIKQQMDAQRDTSITEGVGASAPALQMGMTLPEPSSTPDEF